MPQARDHGHGRQHLTDVGTHRVVATARGDSFTIAWDYPGRSLLEVLILRSCERFASCPDDGPDQGQVEVYRDVTGSFRDTGLSPDRPCYYTVFARQADGAWRRWGEYASVSAPSRRWGAVGRSLRRGLRLRVQPLLLVVACLAAVPLALPGRAAAADPVAPTQTVDERAVAVARADPRVAAVLNGVAAEATTRSWGQGVQKGATVVFRWEPASARDVEATWPLLKQGSDSVPTAPFTVVEHRLRLSGLTALRVDVLTAQGSVLQIVPTDGPTKFDLHEETWPPFAWLPWLTRRPWLPAPFFVVAGVLLAVRSWKRSRAWNRRVPSMTRHDRQFIGRVGVLVLLIGGIAWQVYEGFVAFTGPSVDSGSFSPNEITALPLLLIPPALFLAALVLELSSGSHRAAWALLAVLVVFDSAYNLATAMTTSVTNLNLGFYLLLAGLALVALPRSFSRGKMGWSRTFQVHT